MIGYKLTLEQKESIQGQFYATYEFFNCVQDINDEWFTFLSNDNKKVILETQYEWVLFCPQEEYVAKPSEINLA